MVVDSIHFYFNRRGLAKVFRLDAFNCIPYLCNLSNLQGYITSKYKGWTTYKVIKIAQSLYEMKYFTYPRTASVVLEERLVE